MGFSAYRVLKPGLNQGQVVDLELEQLAPGSIVIEAEWSSLNYKDALAISGQGKILRRFPLNPGIDVAGVIISSEDSRFVPGMSVLVTGCGLGESQDGGYSQLVRVPADWIIALPAQLSTREAMIYGTAGFTAALCVHRLLTNGQTADKGPMLVTGASGGVGSLAVTMLHQLGFEVIAVSGKTEWRDRLLNLGASQVLRPDELSFGQQALESVRFGGAIDNVGGAMLEGLLRHISLWGNVASVGLAGGSTFQATVMPFILRGVSLLGISSTNCPTALRQELWLKLSQAWRVQNLTEFVDQEITLEQLSHAAQRMLSRQTVGRTLVRLK